jgi:hypothetical protein
LAHAIAQIRDQDGDFSQVNTRPAGAMRWASVSAIEPHMTRRFARSHRNPAMLLAGTGPSAKFLQNLQE